MPETRSGAASASDDDAAIAALIQTCVTTACALEAAKIQSKQSTVIWRGSNSPEATSSRVAYDRFLELFLPFLRSAAPRCWDVCLYWELNFGDSENCGRLFNYIDDTFDTQAVIPSFVWTSVHNKPPGEMTAGALLAQDTVPLSSLNRAQAAQYTRSSRQTAWDLLTAVILPHGELRDTMDDMPSIIGRVASQKIDLGKSFFAALIEFDNTYNRLVTDGSVRTAFADFQNVRPGKDDHMTDFLAQFSRVIAAYGRERQATVPIDERARQLVYVVEQVHKHRYARVFDKHAAALVRGAKVSTWNNLLTALRNFDDVDGVARAPAVTGAALSVNSMSIGDYHPLPPEAFVGSAGRSLALPAPAPAPSPSPRGGTRRPEGARRDADAPKYVSLLRDASGKVTQTTWLDGNRPCNVPRADGSPCGGKHLNRDHWAKTGQTRPTTGVSLVQFDDERDQYSALLGEDDDVRSTSSDCYSDDDDDSDGLPSLREVSDSSGDDAPVAAPAPAKAPSPEPAPPRRARARARHPARTAGLPVAPATPVSGADVAQPPVERAAKSPLVRILLLVFSMALACVAYSAFGVRDGDSTVYSRDDDDEYSVTDDHVTDASAFFLRRRRGNIRVNMVRASGPDDASDTDFARVALGITAAIGAVAALVAAAPHDLTRQHLTGAIAELAAAAGTLVGPAPAAPAGAPVPVAAVPVAVPLPPPPPVRVPVAGVTKCARPGQFTAVASVGGARVGGFAFFWDFFLYPSSNTSDRNGELRGLYTPHKSRALHLLHGLCTCNDGTARVVVS
jgi:hypothetical protein